MVPDDFAAGTHRTYGCNNIVQKIMVLFFPPFKNTELENAVLPKFFKGQFFADLTVNLTNHENFILEVLSSITMQCYTLVIRAVPGANSGIDANTINL